MNTVKNNFNKIPLEKYTAFEINYKQGVINTCFFKQIHPDIE